jgi:sugar phosphate isomerase/epimerase
MIVACGEWGLRELTIPQHFEFCKKLGFHYLEIGIGGDDAGRFPEKMSDQEISDFWALKKQYDIETPWCVLVNDFTVTSDDLINKELENVTYSLPLVKKLGSKIVRIFAGWMHPSEVTEEIWQRMINALKQCASEAEKLDLELAVETHGRIIAKDDVFYHVHTVSTERTALKRLLAEMPDSIGICYDPGNMRAVNPKDKTYGLDIVNDRTNYCHLKDWITKKDGWYQAAPGDSDLDYSELLPKMKYDGAFTIEYEPTEDVEDGFKRGLRYLKSINKHVTFY